MTSNSSIELKELDGKEYGVDQVHKFQEVKDISWLVGLWHFSTGKWLNDRELFNTEDLRDQLMNSQTQVALVAALFLTISIPALFLTSSMNDDWWKDVFGLLINLSNALLTSSVFLSVTFMLAINECSSSTELFRFKTAMGAKMHFSVRLFIAGSVVFGGLSLGFWCLQNFNWRWAVGYLGGPFALSGVILFPVVGTTVSTLYSIKNKGKGIITIKMPILAKEFKQYLESRNGIDYASEEDFSDWLLERAKAFRLTTITKKRITAIWEKAVEALINEELKEINPEVNPS